MTPRTITIHLPCIACDYDLRGLAEDAVCPECGLSVHESARGLSPAIARALRCPLGLLVLLSIWRPIAVLTASILLIASNMRPPFTDPSLKIMAGLVALATVLAEWWAIATLARRVVRYTPAWVRTAAIACACSVGALTVTAIPGVARTMAGYVGVVAVPLLILIPAVASLVLCSTISRRLLRDEGLARWCKVAAVAVPLMATVGLVFGAVGPLFAVLIQFATVLGIYSKLEPMSSPAHAPDLPESPPPTQTS